MLRLIVMVLIATPVNVVESPAYFRDSIIKVNAEAERIDSLRDSDGFFLWEKAFFERLEQRVSNREFYIILLLLLLLVSQLCLILSVGVGRFVRKSRRLQEEKQQLIIQINELSNSISERLKMSSEEGMTFFNVLSQVYWQNQPEKVVPTLQLLLEDLVSDKKVINQMVETLNKTRDNILVRLIESVPSLGSRDILLYCYLAIRFDHNAICMILKKTPGALNAQVYRLRRKINESDSIWKEEFLDAIS